MSASSLAEPLPVAATATERAEVPRWSLSLRIAFRFVFVFLGLVYFPFPLSLIPTVAAAVQKAWNAAIVAVGKGVFGLAIDIKFNGSGDKTADWIQLFVTVALSVVATVIWSIADRKAVSYPRLWRWFHVYLRFGLALSMIVYGAYKLIPSQFVSPGLDRLLQPIGDASPMGLLWTFMGASMGYTMFTGFGEMLGGLLLTIRRTTLLGALVSAGVMTHVVALNFFYDVPVKIYSSLLLLTALVIAAPDTKALFRFFIAERPVEPLFQRRGLRIAARVVTVLFVVGIVGMQVSESWEQRKNLRESRLAPTALSGVWEVDPLTTDVPQWRRFVVAGKGWGAIQTMDDSVTRYVLAIDEKAIVMTKRIDPHFRATLTYERPDAKTLRLNGTFDGQTITATLHKRDEPTYRLNSRGFHWINESPFNR